MSNRFLIAAAVLSALASLLHVACIYFGAPWYRFFGAGEEMARMAEAGSWFPGLVTAGIAAVLGIWSLYALSGAGVIRRLPLLRTALCIITAIYLLRGLMVLPVAFLHPQDVTTFLLWSSAICLGFGVVHLIGLLQRWRLIATGAAFAKVV
jgi:hypothetical protein